MVASYLLLLEVLGEVSVPLGSRTWSLSRGYFVYIGSSSYPRPYLRVLRHLSPAKRRRWHVDHLTTCPQVKPVAGILLYGVSEGELYLALASSSIFEAAIPGFGSTDSRGHLTHLFRLKEVEGADPTRTLLELAQATAPHLVEVVLAG